MPIVSVILPNYNHAAFLPQRIDSILQQTYQNFELIILDDCSTDNSNEIIESYRHHTRVSHIVLNTQNSGSTFKQWKRGVALAKGELVWIAESDDWADINFLITLVDKFRDENVSLAYCRTKSVNENQQPGTYKWGEVIQPDIWEGDNYFKGQTFINKFLKYRNVIPNASAVIFRKDHFTDADGILEMRFAGDWLLWINIAAKGNVVYSCKSLNYFRRHSASTRSLQSFKKEWRRMEEYFTCIHKACYIIGSSFEAFNKEYNWITEQWLQRMTAFGLRKTLRPPFPFLFLFRVYYKLFISKF